MRDIKESRARARLHAGRPVAPVAEGNENMVAVIISTTMYNDVLDGRTSPFESRLRLATCLPDMVRDAGLCAVAAGEPVGIIAAQAAGQAAL